MKHGDVVAVGRLVRSNESIERRGTHCIGNLNDQFVAFMKHGDVVAVGYVARSNINAVPRTRLFSSVGKSP